MMAKNNNPIYTLSIEEFKQLIEETVKAALNGKTPGTSTDAPTGRLVYGLRGIEQLFGVSHKTAQYYKDHVIQEAVSQNGRKIVVDADLALKLFNERR